LIYLCAQGVHTELLGHVQEGETYGRCRKGFAIGIMKNTVEHIQYTIHWDRFVGTYKSKIHVTRIYSIS